MSRVIALVGGSGGIGQHILDALVNQKKHRVIVLSRKVRTTKERERKRKREREREIEKERYHGHTDFLNDFILLVVSRVASESAAQRGITRFPSLMSTNLCCTVLYDITIETNKYYHDVRYEILHRFGYDMVVQVQKIKRKAQMRRFSSPPSFKGRR